MNRISQWMMSIAVVLISNLILSSRAPAQSLTTLYSFGGTDGYSADALIQGTDGNLYGATRYGGVPDHGTLFQLTPAGSVTWLYDFCSHLPCKEGAWPNGIIQATDGNFYGTTEKGGRSSNTQGTFFRFTSGTLTTLNSFVSADGTAPFAGVIQATNGDFYGTTPQGGAHASGTVFKVTAEGKITTLYSFCSQSNCTDGANPYARLLQATDGNFYGTTEMGGGGACAQGCGTVFRITPEGTLTTLYSFCSQTGCADGKNPVAGLVQGTNGELYGTTQTGGDGSKCPSFGCGTVFKITADGTLSTLHVFNGSLLPNELMQASDGNFYGTTQVGGSGTGTIFKMTPGGKLTLVYSFCLQTGCMDGAMPVAPLVQDTAGDFYGTTTEGGSGGLSESLGTIFRLSLGLGPFVKAQTSIGTIGETIGILGTDLTGASSVLFNGVAATFTIVSASEITATVPAGASSGFIEVQTPAGTLISSAKFRVKN